jgi:iron complex outermembrane recepter protein
MPIIFKRTFIAGLVAASWPAFAQGTPPAGQPLEPKDAATPASQKLETVTVTGMRQKATATRQDAELRDLPQAVTIIPQQVLEERAFTRIEDLGYATVNLLPNAPYTGGVSIGFFSRGFNGSSVLIDGYNAGVVSGFTSNVFELASVEKVEVLRGPASVLYGQGNPGGVVNLTFKRPMFEPGLAAELALDSFGQRRSMLDVNQPLNAAAALRLVGVIEDSNTFRDFGEKKTQYLSPALRLKLTPDTTLDALYAWGRYKFNNDRAFGAVPELVQNLPARRNLAEPWLPLTTYESRSARMELEHRLSRQWALTAAVFDNKTTNAPAPEIGFSGVQPGTALVDRYYIDYPNKDTNRAADRTFSLRLRGDVHIAGLRHQLLLGAERVKAFYVYEAFSGEVGPIDYLNPVYSAGPVRPADTFEYAGGGGSRTQALYVNDLISFGDHWKLQLGLRHDRLETDGYTDAQLTVGDRQERSKTTPSIGVVFQPTPSTSLYANRAESFLPQFGRSVSGAILDPEIGKSFEVGVKQELRERRLALTAAVFDIEKRGILTIDPNNSCCNLNGGTARSRGLELELSGRLSRAVELRAGLGTSDTKWTQSNDFPVGARLVGVPRVTAVLGGTLRPQSGALAGSWWAADLAYAGQREWLPTGDSYKLPAYTRLDLAAGWKFEQWEIQANLKNATDERITLSNGYGLVAPDAPRTFGITVRYRTGVL